MNGTRAPGLLLSLLLAMVLAAACGSATLPATPSAAADHVSPTDPCADSPDWAGTICPDAIAIANARLGWLHWPVTSTAFRTSMCPPNARCMFVPVPHDTWVIFTFAVGDPVMIRVGPTNVGGAIAAGLVAGDPEPLPDWLLQEVTGIRPDTER